MNIVYVDDDEPYSYFSRSESNYFLIKFTIHNGKRENFLFSFSHFYLVTLISLFFKLLFFQNYIQIENQRIINWQVGDHVSFVPETGALLLRSVSFRDSGDYLCLVNNKRENGQVRLMVQGKILFIQFFIHLFTLMQSLSFKQPLTEIATNKFQMKKILFFPPIKVINLSAGRHHDDRPIDLLHLVTTIYTFVCLFVYLGASGQVVIN